MTDAELLHTINDCSEALEANPGGHKAGYYADEIHYCAMEVAKRRGETDKLNMMLAGTWDC